MPIRSTFSTVYCVILSRGIFAFDRLALRHKKARFFLRMMG